MKKFYLFLFFASGIFSIYSQTQITLTFLGEEASTHNYLPLERVYIQNTTLGCDTTIYGNTPSILLTIPLGIQYQTFLNTEPFIISPPVPNPFNGSTNIQIQINQSGTLKLTITDLRGKIISEYQNDFKPGIHKFEINSSITSLQLLKASNGNLIKYVKLINTGNDNREDRITLLGIENQYLKSNNANTTFIFQFGNQLLFRSIKTGYSDKIIIDSPTQNSSYTFELTTASNITEPSVITSNLTNITTSTAISGGNVYSDGGATVTERGVCWNTALDPTITSSHTTDGSGVGTFVSSLTSLTPNTLYYVRAFARNSVGIAYGNQLTFTSSPNLNFPTVTTSSITNITQNTATCGGTITSDGGSIVTDRGVCWGTSSSPTIADNHTTDGIGTGTFVSSLMGLSPNTMYYVRAFATNNSGIAYGNEEVFTTFPIVSVPTISTSSVTNITQTTATSGGNVTSDGGATVTARGVCWNRSSNPTVDNSHTTDGLGTGTFVSNLTGLTPNTLYYVRAYATNNAGTAYGNQMSFSTLAWSCGSSATITHLASGGVAPVNKTVTYGTIGNIPGENSKCWIISNLGADHQATSKDDDTEASAGWYWQFNRKQGYKHDGTIRTPSTTWINSISENFDWQATNDPCNIELGNDWHIPTKTEWNNVMVSGNWNNWTDTWNSMLKLHGAGDLQNNDGSLYNRGEAGDYWSSTMNSLGNGWNLDFLPGFCDILHFYKPYGLTLRCIKENEGSATIPSVTTSAVANITQTTATSGGNVTSDGGATVTTRGICWSTSSNPTIANSHTTDGNGLGTFISSLTGLTPNTLYYVRAYATNSAGTGYGNQVIFTTLSNATIPTVTTSPVTNITQTTALSGGNITSDGGAVVTLKGVCWSTSPNPTTANNHTSDGGGTGAFSSYLTSLSAITTYYVKAYAINSVGTAYGNEVVFTTLMPTPTYCPGTPTVYYLSKIYNTVQIGTQCWLKENLNVGTKINGTQYQDPVNGIIEKFCYNNLESNCDIYGGLYQWEELMQGSTTPGIQGICPPGWHIPTEDEWTTLTSYMGGMTVAGGKMKEVGFLHWSSPNTGATNESGFTGLGGGVHDTNGTFAALTTYTWFWTSTRQPGFYNESYERGLYSDQIYVSNGAQYYNYGHYVRCVKD